MKKRVAVIALLLLGILALPKNNVTSIEYTNKIYKKAANETFNGSITFNSYIKPKKFVAYAHDVNHINPTADGGWVASEAVANSKYFSNVPGLNSIVKYNSSGVIEWENAYIFNTFTSGVVYELQNRKSVKFDGFSAPYHMTSGDRDTATQVIGSPDGGIFVQSYRNAGIFAKFDKDGNLLWKNQDTYYYSKYTCTRACEINDENVQDGKYRFYSYYQPTDSYTTSMWLDAVDGEKLKLDDHYYACGCKPTNGTYNGMNNVYSMLAPLPDGGVAQLIKTNNSFLLGDGSTITFDNYSSSEQSMFVLIYDKDGNLIQVVDLVQYMRDVYPAYASKNNVSGTFKFDSDPRTFRYIGAYDNGDLLVMIDGGRHMAKLHYNQSTNKYEPIWYSKGFYTSANIGGDLQVQLINETGGFAVQSDDRSSYKNIDSLPKNLQDQSIADRMSEYTEGLIFEYADDADGKGTHLSNVITTAIYMKYYTYIDDETEDIREADIIHPEVTNMNTQKHPTFVRMEDGSYIVGVAYNPKARGENNVRSNKVANTYKLADGTIKRIKDDTTFVVYRINKNDRIEWAQEYSTTFGASPGIFDSNLYTVNKSRLSFDKKHLLIPVAITVGFDFKDITTDDAKLLFNNECSGATCYGNTSLFLLYDVGYDKPDDPITPEPEVKGEEVEVENPQTGLVNHTIKLVVIITLLLSIYYMLGKFNMFKKI